MNGEESGTGGESVVADAGGEDGAGASAVEDAGGEGGASVVADAGGEGGDGASAVVDAVNNTDINISLGLAFPKAGLLFNIGVITQAGYPTLFRLLVTDPEQKRVIPFREYECPCLADWAPGFCRWLVRANVTATYDVREGVSGRFAEGLTPEEVMQGVSEACDMIRQRFELYEESVVVG